MANPKTESVEATLKKAHRHKGIEHRPGAKITLRKDQAERLTKREII